MNQEQMDKLSESLKKAKNEMAELETMIDDYNACKSETSKKYLGAAVKKIAVAVVESFDSAKSALSE